MTSTKTQTYDHAAEAAARADALAAAKSELIRARQERQDAEDATEGNPADVSAWRAAQDRLAFAVEMVNRAERGVRAAERGLLNTDTELGEVMAQVLKDAFYGLPITVQPHKRLEIPAKPAAPTVVLCQLKPGTRYAQFGTLSGVVHVAFFASQPWARIPTVEELHIAGRTVAAAPIYTVHHGGPVTEAPTGWPSAWFEIRVSAVTDPAFVTDVDNDGPDVAHEVGPVFAAM